MSELVHFCKVNGPDYLYKTIHTYENDHWLIDIEGNKYLDTMSGCRTSILGHGAKSIKEAMKTQMDELPYYPTVFHSYNSIAHKGTEILNQEFPVNTEVFYTPTGSLANESAIKFATKYWELKGEKHKKVICYMTKSYHGTTGLIGCTSDQPINSFMNLDLKFPSSKIDVSFYNEKIDVKETLEYIEYEFKYNHNIAAIIIDPISTSGLYSYDSYFWENLSFLADKYEVLIILDEVVTGFGKTGYMFASHKWNIKADIITLGKGMANGYFPLAATLCNKRITEKLDWLLHGMTFSSHPIGIAAFIENHRLLTSKLTTIKDRFDKGIHRDLAQKLNSEYIKSIRIHGVLGGLTSTKDLNVRLVEEEGWKRGIIVYAGGGPKSTKLTWCLPITLSDKEIKFFFDILQTIFDDFKVKEKGRV